MSIVEIYPIKKYFTQLNYFENYESDYLVKQSLL